MLIVFAALYFSDITWAIISFFMRIFSYVLGFVLGLFMNKNVSDSPDLETLKIVDNNKGAL